MSGNDLYPLYIFEEVSRAAANELLTRWKHRMGPFARGNQAGIHYALFEQGEPVAITSTATLIRERVGGASHLTRENTIELARLCAARPGLCRVALRLWREGVFPMLNYQHAVSYQDANLHTGNTYRFDGWTRIAYSHSGTDTRSGRKGRNKWVWIWPGPGRLQ